MASKRLFAKTEFWLFGALHKGLISALSLVCHVTLQKCSASVSKSDTAT